MALIKRLQDEIGDKVDFIHSSQLRSGQDLQQFMKEGVLNAHAVMPLFSPDYKAKAENSEKSGVLTEYRYIVQRIDPETSRRFKPLLLVPVIWRGADHGQCCPKLLSRKYARNLTEYRSYSDHEFFIPTEVREKTDQEIENIVEDLENRWREDDPEYGSFQDEVNDALAIDETFYTKAERTRIGLPEFNTTLFVNTQAYRSLTGKNSTFTGRKGSGKTTLVKMYKYRNSKSYFYPLDIEVNDWKLHHLLNDLSFSSKESDFSYTEHPSEIFTYIWPVFLVFCLTKSLGRSQNTRSQSYLENTYYADRVTPDSRFEELFALATQAVSEFFQEQVDNSSTESEADFRRDLRSKVHVDACVEYLTGKNFKRLLSAIDRDEKKRRFLFTFDRFDTEIQLYRKELQLEHMTVDARTKIEAREVYWLQGLVEMVDYLGSPDAYSETHNFYRNFGKHIHFCVPLPKDRIQEVQNRRRDAVVGNLDQELDWHPAELLTMLRKRLQRLWAIDETEIDKSNMVRARSRFDYVVELSQRRFPKKCPITLGTAKFDIDVFLNVLRHSFFRPRDVILYYAKILPGVEIAFKRGETLSAGAIASLISEQTYKIVEEEFLGEFADTISNFRDVIGTFRSSNQVMDYDEIAKILAKSEFRIFGGDELISSEAKLKLLYEIGFIGVAAKNQGFGNFPTDDFDFTFTNARHAESLVSKDVNSNLIFAIHPIFIEYLKLKINTKQPVLMLDWAKIEASDPFGSTT